MINKEEMKTSTIKKSVGSPTINNNEVSKGFTLGNLRK